MGIYGHVCLFCWATSLEWVSYNLCIPHSAEHIVEVSVTASPWSKHLFPCLEHLPGTTVEEVMCPALSLSIASEIADHGAFLNPLLVP